MEEVVYGVIGIVLTAAIIRYTIQTIRNFNTTDDVTMAINLPHGKVQIALELFVSSFVIFSIAMLAGAAGLFLENPTLDTVSRIGGGITLLGATYFLKNVEKATRPDPESIYDI